MAVIGEAFIAVKPDAKGFGADAEKGVLGSVTSIAKKASVILGGAFAVQKGFDFLKGSVAAARESNAIAAQTAAAIKSTGGAANVSAKEIDQLANSIARKTGIDDEQIAKASNLLLTFTNVRNEAGKGNDIFNQSTKILADMGKALGTDASGAAIQLGKALNDPVAGISALTRVGVTFNDKQKETIKNLVATGKTAEAQKIILAELGKEFGGSAEAQATASDKLKVTLGNLQEQIGNKLIPIIDKAAGFLADKLPGAIDFAGRAFGAISRFVQPAIEGIRDLIHVIQGWDPGDITGPTGAFRDLLNTVFKVQEGVRAFFKTLTTGFTEDEGTPIEKFALIIRKDVLPVVERITTFIGDHLKPILIGLAAAFLVITSPVAAAVAALVILYTKITPVREAIDFLIGQLGNLASAFSERFAAIEEAVGHVLKGIEIAIAIALAPILLIWRQWGDQIMAIVGVVFDQIKLIIDTAVRVIRDIIDLVLAIINGDWGAAWDALKDIPAAVLGYVVGTIGNIMEIMKQLISGAVEAAVSFFAALPGRLLGLAGAIGGAALSIGKSIIEGIGKGLSAAVGFAGDVASSVLKAIKNVINTQVIDRINSGIPDSLGAGPFKVNLPKNPIPRLAAGALVTARPGGVIAQIAEGARDEAVLPLPPGLIAGLEAIARGQFGAAREQTPLVGQLVLQGATIQAAEANAASVVRELRAEAWRQGK